MKVFGQQSVKKAEGQSVPHAVCGREGKVPIGPIGPPPLMVSIDWFSSLVTKLDTFSWFSFIFLFFMVVCFKYAYSIDLWLFGIRLISSKVGVTEFLIW